MIDLKKEDIYKPLTGRSKARIILGTGKGAMGWEFRNREEFGFISGIILAFVEQRRLNNAKRKSK